jgi:aryl-alcohol dehydrogenase-like predicted oxidoreductase
MAYGSLAHGILAGAFTEETRFEENDWRNRGDRPIFGLRLFAPDDFKKELRAVERFKQVAARRGKKVAHLALAWVLSNPVIGTALVGCRNAAEVEDNVEALGWEVSEGERREIDAICQEEGIDPAPDTWLEQVA